MLGPGASYALGVRARCIPPERGIPLGTGRASRAELLHDLRGIDFPAGKDGLLAQARKNDADQKVIEAIEKLPEQRCSNMAEVAYEYHAAVDREEGKPHPH